jgi:hypothetical protein
MNRTGWGDQGRRAVQGGCAGTQDVEATLLYPELQVMILNEIPTVNLPILATCSRATHLTITCLEVSGRALNAALLTLALTTFLRTPPTAAVPHHLPPHPPAHHDHDAL